MSPPLTMVIYILWSAAWPLVYQSCSENTMSLCNFFYPLAQFGHSYYCVDKGRLHILSSGNFSRLCLYAWWCPIGVSKIHVLAVVEEPGAWRPEIVEGFLCWYSSIACISACRLLIHVCKLSFRWNVHMQNYAEIESIFSSSSNLFRNSLVRTYVFNCSPAERFNLSKTNLEINGSGESSTPPTGCIVKTTGSLCNDNIGT